MYLLLFSSAGELSKTCVSFVLSIKKTWKLGELYTENVFSDSVDFIFRSIAQTFYFMHVCDAQLRDKGETTGDTIVLIRDHAVPYWLLPHPLPHPLPLDLFCIRKDLASPDAPPSSPPPPRVSALSHFSNTWLRFWMLTLFTNITNPPQDTALLSAALRSLRSSSEWHRSWFLKWHQASVTRPRIFGGQRAPNYCSFKNCKVKKESKCRHGGCT